MWTMVPDESAPNEDKGSVSSHRKVDSNTVPFFRRVDWFSFVTTLITSLAAYILTLAPTVTLEDSGELVVAADYLGVPHPPGYPIWTLLAWFFLPTDISEFRRVLGGALLGLLSWLLVMMGRLLD